MFDEISEWIFSIRKTKIRAKDLLHPKVKPLVDFTHKILKRGVSKGITYHVPDEMLRHFDENLYIFSGCKTFEQLRAVSDLLTDAEGAIKPYYKFKKEVLSVHNSYNKQYLKVEYNLAVSSAQSASNWQRFQQYGDRYLLQYRTAGDDRVRPSHQILNGTTLPLSSPFWQDYFPPNDWSCRCTVVQVLRDRESISDESDALEKGLEATTRLNSKGNNAAEIFRFNPGISQTIFPKHHPYFVHQAKVKKVLDNE